MTSLLMAVFGRRNGTARTRFFTAPLRMQRVQTRAVRFVPLGVVIWIVCRLGRNVRREMPVTLVPTPPRYFALPRVVIWLPVTGLRPHTSQDWAIQSLPLARGNWQSIESLLYNRLRS